MNIYNNLYTLIEQYVFGNAIVTGSNQELIATLVATFGTLFVIAIPFALVWKVIKLIAG